MKLNLLCAAAVVGVVLAGTAQAGTITVYGTGFANAQLTATNATGASAVPNGFPALLNLGNAGTNGLVSTNTVNFQGGTINFPTPNTTPKSGVYDGTSASATSAFSGTNLGTGNYIAAQPNDTVTVNFTTAQTAFSLLWGTVDSYNSITFDLLLGNTDEGTITVTGSQVNQATGNQLNLGTSPAFVTLNNFHSLFGTPFDFDTIKVTSTALSAFEFDPALPAATATPEPASLAVLGAGLLGMGALRRRRNA